MKLRRLSVARLSPRAALLLILAMTQLETHAMGLFGKYTLFSAVSGHLVDQGSPVAGATITQSAKLGDTDVLSQTTVTAEDGFFSFPAITRKKGLSSLLPQQFAVGQSIKIDAEGQSHEGWIYTKLDPSPGAENAGQPLLLLCELSEEPEYRGQTFGICKLVAAD